MTTEYLYVDTGFETTMDFERALGALIGWTPALVVDSQNPRQVFVRDLYI